MATLASVEQSAHREWVHIVRDKAEHAARIASENYKIEKWELETIKLRVKQLVGNDSPRQLLQTHRLPYISQMFMRYISPLRKVAPLLRQSSLATARILRDHQLVRDFIRANRLVPNFYREIEEYAKQIDEYFHYWEWIDQHRGRKLPMFSRYNDEKIFDQVFVFIKNDEVSHQKINTINQAILKLLSSIKSKEQYYRLVFSPAF